MSDQPYTGAAGVVLAATHADPDDAMLAQTLRVLPRLQELYSAIVVVAAPDTGRRTVETLRERGVQVVQRAAAESIETLGLVRIETLRHGLARGGSHLHYCDWDRVLHWAELYADELRDVVAAIGRHDFLILGRTPRAFATHPQMQRDTEALINHVFGLAFGQELDVTAAARGLSRRAAEVLLALEQPEPSLGNDCAWPLVLAREPNMIIGYARTEGLEWETPDRYGDAIAAAGGLDAWIANYDADPGRWEFRTRLALLEVAAANRWRAT
jgi:hypothetical protein